MSGTAVARGLEGIAAGATELSRVDGKHGLVALPTDVHALLACGARTIGMARQEHKVREPRAPQLESMARMPGGKHRGSGSAGK